MPSSGMLRRVAVVGTDVSEECSASIVRVKRIGKRRFLQEPRGVSLRSRYSSVCEIIKQMLRNILDQQIHIFRYALYRKFIFN
jgi:hypothetical protein